MAVDTRKLNIPLIPIIEDASAVHAPVVVKKNKPHERIADFLSELSFRYSSGRSVIMLHAQVLLPVTITHHVRTKNHAG